MTRPLRRNETPCPACGKIVLVRRAEAHSLTVECHVRQVARAYKERGWARAEGWAGTLAGAGVPIERAPVSVTTEQMKNAPEPWKSRGARRLTKLHAWKGPQTLVEVPFDGPWAPAAAVQAVKLLSNARIPSWMRRGALRALLAEPELISVVDAIRRFGGPEAIAVWVKSKVWIKSVKRDDG